MKQIITTLFGLALMLATTTTQAQETYFNVPESEITEKKKILVQQQLDYSDEFHSATTFNYGLGKNWEIGANLYHLTYQPEAHRFVRNDTSTYKPYSPLLLLNAQKVFEIASNVRIGIGGQGGINLTPTHGRSSLVGYAYANVAGTFKDDHYRWSAGAYTSHARFLGGKAPLGFQAGIDAGIFYEKLHFIGDWISGNHELGQLILGLEVFLSKSVPLAVGWQRLNKDGSPGAVIQISYIPQN